jgi:hypothetical protein
MSSAPCYRHRLDMTFYWVIITLALSLATERGAIAAQLPTFAQHEWRMLCQSYPDLRSEPEAAEALLTQVAETEIRASRDPSRQPLSQRLALVRAGDAYHWLGHYLESSGDSLKAFRYHYLSWLQYQSAAFASSSGLSDINPIQHAETHLVMLAQGHSLAHYLYVRRFSRKSIEGHLDLRDHPDLIKAAEYTCEFLKTTHHGPLVFLGSCGKWILESIETPTRTDPHLRIHPPDRPVGDLSHCSDSEPC